MASEKADRPDLQLGIRALNHSTNLQITKTSLGSLSFSKTSPKKTRQQYAYLNDLYSPTARVN
jgi:hypothetical protein